MTLFAYCVELVAEASYLQNTQSALNGLRNCYPSNQAATKLLLGPHDHRIRPLYTIPKLILQIKYINMCLYQYISLSIFLC